MVTGDKVTLVWDRSPWVAPSSLGLRLWDGNTGELVDQDLGTGEGKGNVRQVWSPRTVTDAIIEVFFRSVHPDNPLITFAIAFPAPSGFSPFDVQPALSLNVNLEPYTPIAGHRIASNIVVTNTGNTKLWDLAVAWPGGLQGCLFAGEQKNLNPGRSLTIQCVSGTSPPLFGIDSVGESEELVFEVEGQTYITNPDRLNGYMSISIKKTINRTIQSPDNHHYFVDAWLDVSDSQPGVTVTDILPGEEVEIIWSLAGPTGSQGALLQWSDVQVDLYLEKNFVRSLGTISHPDLGFNWVVPFSESTSDGYEIVLSLDNGLFTNIPFAIVPSRISPHGTPLPPIVLNAGNFRNILWTETKPRISWAGRSPETGVDIALVSTTGLSTVTIINDAQNIGYYDWDIPTLSTLKSLGLNVSLDYRVVVETNPTSYKRGSLEAFRVLEPNLEITHPAGGEPLPSDGGGNVRWVYSGPRITGTVQLLQNNSLIETTGQSASMAQSSHPYPGIKDRLDFAGGWSWSIDDETTLGSGYQIQIETPGGLIGAKSRRTFSIVDPPKPSLSVWGPDGAFPLTRGTTETVWWQDGGIEGGNSENIKLSLYHDDGKWFNFISVIKSQTPNDHTYDWTIPCNLQLFDNYRIKIELANDPTVFDFGRNFKIQAPRVSTYTIDKPTGSTVWTPDSTVNIKWTQPACFDSANKLFISVLKGGSHFEVINLDTADDGSISWAIPAVFPVGSDYQISIRSITDTSDEKISPFFSINVDDDDDDNDLIPDAYEDTNGMDSTDSADANTDDDGDGYSNKAEYFQGTDIHDSLSKPLVAPTAPRVFDDFSGPAIDRDRWNNSGAYLLLSDSKLKMFTRTTGENGSTQRTRMTLKDSTVTALESTVTIDEATLTGGSLSAFARLEGIYYSTQSSPVAGNWTGSVWAAINIGDRGSGLEAWWEIDESTDADFDSFVATTGQVVAPGTLLLDVPYQLKIVYDGTNGFTFSLGATSVIETGPTNLSPPANGYRRLATGADILINSGSDKASVLAWFDDIKVNNDPTVLEDFSGTDIDTSKWVEEQFARIIDSEKLKVESYGQGGTKTVHTQLDSLFGDTDKVKAAVTLLGASDIPINSRGRVRIEGYWYNQSVDAGNGDSYNGVQDDVWAQVVVEKTTSGELRATAYAEVANDPNHNSVTQLFFYQFTKPVLLDREYLISIELDHKMHELVFSFDGEIYRHPVATPIYPSSPPNVYRSLAARIQNGPGVIRVLFDDVSIAALDTDEDGFADVEDGDDDNDGMSDTYENDHGLDPLDPSDAQSDLDADGLNNLAESNLGTDPNQPDTDFDGIDDRLDRDPLSSNKACSLAEAIYTDVVHPGEDITCAANTSISVESTAEVQGTGHLELIAPHIETKPGFKVNNTGGLSVKATHPCASCP